MKCEQVGGCRQVKFRGVNGKEGEFEFEIAKYFTCYTNCNTMLIVEIRGEVIR